VVLCVPVYTCDICVLCYILDILVFYDHPVYT
jgi:hypothetical protein